MPLPRYAPIDGYRELIDLRIWRTPLGPFQSNIPDRDDRNSGYFFRIRTVIDDKGAIISARYGKIVGAISFYPLEGGRTPLTFCYFISGTDNDRNMEHQIDTNLFDDSDSAGRQRR